MISRVSDTFRLARMPAGPTGIHKAYAGSHTLALTRRGSGRTDAVALLRFLTSPEQQLTEARRGSVPTRPAVLAEVTSVADAAEAERWELLDQVIAAGLLAGNCMLPMKFARRWPWESVWLVFSIVSLLVLPWTLAFIMIANPFAVYAALPASAFVAPVLFGAGWGVAQILFGLSIARLGMALGYAIVVGLGALLGTLIPLLVKHSDIAASGRGALIFAGVAVMILGIVVVAWAGRKREGVHSSGGGVTQSTYAAALALAVLCGLLAPMLNYAFAFGDSIANEAVRLGNGNEAAGYAVWPVALLGGLVPNVGYACFLLWRNQTWKSFHGAWRSDAWCGIAMGALWMAAFAIYGVSSVYLGALGTSAGWALFQIFMIMTANCSGLLTAQWKGAPPSARYGMAAGLVLLSTATALIAPRS